MIEIDGNELYQWDTGRRVVVTGIEVEHVHFANQGDSKAVIMGAVDIHAQIPDFLLQSGKQLCVYAVKDGITVESKTFYVKKRERPENYVYEDDRRNYIYELVENAEMAIYGANLAADNANRVAQNLRDAKDNGEFGLSVLGSYESLNDLITAHPVGEVGDSYLIDREIYVWSATTNSWVNAGEIQGPAGYTPVKGVDYFTDEDVAEFLKHAAPAGFGLNNDFKTTENAADFDGYLTTGWYRYINYSNASLVPGFALYYAICRVDSVSENYIVQTLYPVYVGCTLQRYCRNGVWSEWEWVNPPMYVDVEYRTTDRYKGYAVYKKVDANGNVLWRGDNETSWHLLSSSSFVAAATVE